MVKPDIAVCMDMSLKLVVQFKNLFWLIQTQIPTATQLENTAEFMMNEVSSISIGIFQRFCDIDCSIKVGICGVSTLKAGELRLTRAILLINMPASAAGPARVARVNRYNRHSRKLGFVLNKISKLTKTPFPKLVSLRSGNPDPKAFEVLNRYGFLRAFSATNDPLGNDVVGVSFKSSLSAGKLFQVTLGKFAPFLLQLLSELLVWSEPLS